MPEISRFLGIVIAILYREHDPPHFHATYGEYGITVGILLEDWNLARQHERLKPIPPLE
ncbi:MAG: DUF4160 domain-containing protein [Acidobacteria bacterium]|nr:DUF4160 domain-containing protein [Acidobacteriota bacterium]